jgi:hypothetical protein
VRPILAWIFEIPMWRRVTNENLGMRCLWSGSDGEFPSETPPQVLTESFRGSLQKDPSLVMLQVEPSSHLPPDPSHSLPGTMLAILQSPEWAELIRERGIEIRNYRTTLPMKKGLSSSAAVCALVVQSFSDFFQLNLPLHQVMELAYLGEMNTPSRYPLPPRQPQLFPLP